MTPISFEPYSRSALAVVVALFLAATLPRISFAQTDPWIGTWRLNVAKSTFNPGPGPRSQTATVQSAPGGYRWVVEGTNAQGGQNRSEWPITFDGRHQRVTGSPATDEIASRLIDAYTQQFEYFKDGRSDGTATFVVSRDGSVLTTTSSRLLANGQYNNSVAVYEKQ
jgi:hypothetical protein